MQVPSPRRIDVDRRLGWLAVLGGLGLAFALQLAIPVGIPLYDGVVVQEPYRFLHPQSGQAGDPASFTSSPSLSGPLSPPFVAATTEKPPQVQLIAQGDAFTLPAGTTAMQVSITPVEPPLVAPPGPIAGNVYRVSVTDQGGTPLAFKPCDGCVILVVRAPEGTASAGLQLFANGAWTAVPADHVPTTGMYAWNATALGDFAIVAGTTAAPGGGGLDLIVLVGGAIVLLVLVVGAIAFRSRGSGTSATSEDPSRRRSPGIPSKRTPAAKPARNRPRPPRNPPGSSEP